MTVENKKQKNSRKWFCNIAENFRVKSCRKCFHDWSKKKLCSRKRYYFCCLVFCLWSKCIDFKYNLFNPGYPYELLLAPFPTCLGWWNSIVRGGAREGSHYPFPGHAEGERKFLFLFPSGWLFCFISLYAVVPAIPLCWGSWLAFGCYLGTYFLSFLLVYRCFQAPVLDYLWRQLPAYNIGFIEHVPQRVFTRFALLQKWPIKKFFKSILCSYIIPCRLYKKSRQPVNWSTGSQQECYLVLGIADLFKPKRRDSFFLASPNAKFLIYAYFPVWCSHLLLLLILSSYSFNPWCRATPTFLKSLMVSGLFWAILSLLFGYIMKMFLKRMELNHGRHRFGAQLSRWLPPNIKRGEYFSPSIHHVSLKMISLVQVATFTIYFLLIRVAGTLNPGSKQEVFNIIHDMFKFRFSLW